MSVGAFGKRTRHVRDVVDAPTDVFYSPLDGTKQMLQYKGMLYRSGVLKNRSSKVVGVVGSSGRAGQAAQAVGSTILPGNISPVRSPVRSGIARALTPGGGSGRGGVPGKPERGYRCPEGFQFGGRFTDSNFTTCGKQLFDIPSLRETLGQAVFRTRSSRVDTTVDVEARGGRAKPIESDAPTPNVELMVRRAANVPRVGDGDDKSRSTGVKQAVEAVQNQDGASSVLVRRDGYLMVPVVSSAELRGVPDNRNMEGAAFVQSVRDADAIGGEELGFLSNTGVTSLVYVTPNGVQLRLDRTRDLSTGERRQLGKDVNTAAEMSVDDDPAARLKFIAEKSDGAFEFSQDFGDVKDPESEVSSGEGKGKAKWVVEAFVDAPEERVEEMVAEADTEQVDDSGEAQRVAPSVEEKIGSVDAAVDHLNEGGLIADLEPSVVMEALEKSERYKSDDLGNGFTLFEAEDGRKILLKQETADFEHISAHLTSDVLRELGVQAPAVKFAGDGEDRPFVFRSPDGVVEGAEVDDDLSVADLPDAAIMATQVADWLTDTRGRTSASILGVRVGDESEAVVTVGPPAALIGLDEDELAERRNIGPDDFFSDTTQAYGKTFGEASDEEKQIAVEILDSLIERAQAFSWDDYRAKLSADGTISEAEENHLSIVQELFETRLENLSSSRDAILQILGLA
jgi:hypothetical protein